MFFERRDNQDQKPRLSFEKGKENRHKPPACLSSQLQSAQLNAIEAHIDLLIYCTLSLCSPLEIANQIHKQDIHVVASTWKTTLLTHL